MGEETIRILGEETTIPKRIIAKEIYQYQHEHHQTLIITILTILLTLAAGMIKTEYMILPTIIGTIYSVIKVRKVATHKKYLEKKYDIKNKTLLQW